MRNPLSAATRLAAIAMITVGCATTHPVTPPASSGPASPSTAGSAPVSSGTAGPPSTSGTPRCAAAPVALVGAALGYALRGPIETDSHAVVVCTYGMASGTGVAVVRFQSGESSATFSRDRATFVAHGQQVTDIGGFFDEAFSSSFKSGTNTVVARKGSVEIQVISGAGFAQEKNLITELFSRL